MPEVVIDSGPKSIGQLDLLRGLAIVLMIINHVGVRILEPEAQAMRSSQAILLLSSFAPVLFFFCTGFGAGLGDRRVTISSRLSSIWRACLLVVADQFFWWKNGIPYGLDFLAFIGLASILLNAIRGRRDSVSLCLGLIAATIVLRFGLGPWLRNRMVLPGLGEWFLGTNPLANISYPFSPWMVYPLLGFVLARCYRGTTPLGLPQRWPLLAVMTIIAISSAGFLYLHQAVFFRWGTMSFAYFTLSIGVLLAFVFIAWLIKSNHPFTSRALSVRGPTSFTVVPVHYALIELTMRLLDRRLLLMPTLGLMVALSAASILLSRAFMFCLARWRRPWIGVLLLWTLIALVPLCSIITWSLAGTTMSFAAFVVGQISVGGILALREGRRRQERAVA
jgi:uncharacterized membrane protein